MRFIDSLQVALTAIAASGDSGPGPLGTLNTDFDALGIDGDGSLVAYAVSVLGGPTHASLAQ